MFDVVCTFTFTSVGLPEMQICITHISVDYSYTFTDVICAEEKIILLVMNCLCKVKVRT